MEWSVFSKFPEVGLIFLTGYLKLSLCMLSGVHADPFLSKNMLLDFYEIL